MSDLPPNIDAILSSIRSRMNEDASTPAEAPPPPPVILATPDVPLEALAAVEITGPASTTSLTLETLIKSMLEPMLKAWLDANMPEIVEKMAQSEIKRLTGRD
jgi:hypothetical protein